MLSRNLLALREIRSAAGFSAPGNWPKTDSICFLTENGIFFRYGKLAWTRSISGTLNSLSAVPWGNNQFIAVGDSGMILSSPDGITGDRRNSGMMNTLCAILCGAGKFVAVGDSGTILSSPDGTTWKSRQSGINSTILSIARGDSHFIALANDGVLLTSFDGINWTKRTIAYPLSSILWGNHYYVAAGWMGTIVVSEDGVNWAQQKSGAKQKLNDIAYGDGQFVVVGNNEIILTLPAKTSVVPAWDGADLVI